MAIRRILQLGDPALRRRSKTVNRPDEANETLADLRDTLHHFQQTHGFGRGISAVQIGVLQRVIYLEFEGAEYCLINPEFAALSQNKFTLWDDCFSFPELMVKLERSLSAIVRYTDETGEQRRLNATGALSELLQHEMDHLDGILAVDRALDGDSLATRDEWLRQRPNRPPESSQWVVTS
jgi:peptide deformylase